MVWISGFFMWGFLDHIACGVGLPGNGIVSAGNLELMRDIANGWGGC